MHVALVSKRYEDAEAGGGAVSAALLVRLLRERGHRVDVLCAETSSTDPGVRKVPLDALRLSRALRELGPDVVHAYNLDAAPATILAAKIARRPVAVTVNGHTSVCLFGDQLHPTKGICGPCSLGKIRTCFTDRPDWQVGRRVPAAVGLAEVKRRSFILDQADLVFTYSRSTRDVLARCNVDAGKVTVVPNMRDPGFGGTSAYEPRFLFVGKMDYPKAPDLLLTALAEALPRTEGWSADFAGDGPLLDQLKERAEAAGIADRVRFHGFVKPDQLRDLYAKASVLVTPVRWEEPFGRIVLEAAGFGIPVLTSDRGGHPEFMDDAETGRVVPAEDAGALCEALVKLAADPDAVRRMGAAARERLARHDPEAVMPQYEAAYRTLVDA